MLDRIEQLKTEISNVIVNNSEELENFRLKYLSRKGLISELFEEFKGVDKSIKGLVGKNLNELKNLAQNLFDGKKQEIEEAKKTTDIIDYTLPGRTYNLGSKHLITQALEDISRIFEKIGFKVAEGFEIEDEYHNFDALNTPDYHPSRDMQDTFYLDSGGKDKLYLLRTHTSPAQIHIMSSQKPPVRVIIPGKCYRNEAISARSLSMFHQVEGLYVDKNVTFRELKGTLDYFAKEFFGKDLKTRLRPSFFPFTEPSGEMDVECYLCKGKGCRICKYTGWLEILGCGMVDPNVFDFVGYDKEEYTGYAFGMGIERTLMIRHGVPDIRMFYENDIRFLKQF
ncbi:MAG: phenylalanine--tRNA ligase subunit alpha [Ignavibacteria bacterium]|jgi:phenylalanyl-tRNA synthetase alpha chain|nr:phenylalanine--tRNA ligase subunit alpha [Ignavibacteria bacterium]